MTLGEILDNGFKVFSLNLVPLLTISFLVMVPYFALTFLIGMMSVKVGGNGFTVVMMGLAMISLFLVQPIATAASTLMTVCQEPFNNFPFHPLWEESEELRKEKYGTRRAGKLRRLIKLLFGD